MRWLVVSILAVGCGAHAAHPTSGGASPLLEYIPADTPYLVANVEAPPATMYEQWRQLAAPMYDALAETARGDRRVQRLFDAIAREFPSGFSGARLEELGFTARPHLAIYGLGLAPVVARIELRDAATALATIERVARNAGLELPPPAVRDGRRYWRVKQAVIAIADNQLVFAAGPEPEMTTALPHVLGLAKPPRSLAQTSLLRDAIARHHLGPHLIGIVDTQAVIALAMHDQHASPECTRAIAGLGALAPRALFGMDAGDAKRWSARFVVELAPELARDLKTLRVPVAGLAGELAARRLATAGGGIHLGRLAELAGAYAQRVDQAGDTCGWSALHDTAAALASLRAKPLPPTAAGLATLYTIAPPVQGKLPERIDMFAVAWMPGVQALAAALGYGDLGVAADGRLHPVSTQTLRIAPLPYAFAVALASDVGAIAVGDKAPALAERVLAAPPGPPMPLFSASFDYGRWLELKARWDASSKDAAERRLDAAMAAMYGRGDYMIDVTDEGLVAEFSHELRR